VAQLVIAYYEKFGRHVPASALRYLDPGNLAGRLLESLATGIQLSATGWGRASPQFSPHGCCIVDERATPKKRLDGEWLQ
jgi:hypothetical protein